MNRNGDPSAVDSAARYERLLSHRAKLEKQLQKADEAIVRFKLEHVNRCSLPEHTMAALRERLARGEEGQGLCCEAGREWLLANTDLDPIWVEILNQWAFDALSCADQRSDSVASNLERFENACEANTWGLRRSLIDAPEGEFRNEAGQPIEDDWVPEEDW